MSKKIMAVILCVAIAVSGCESVDKYDTKVFKSHQEAVLAFGFTNPEYQGQAWFGCPKTPLYALKWKGRTKEGREIDLITCSSPLTGVSVMLR